MKHARIAIAGLALLAAACSSGNTAGEAKPGGTSETSTVAPDSQLASVKPCELISGSEASDVGIRSPEPRRSLGAETCEWAGVGDGGLTVAVETKQGVNDFNYEGDVKTPAKFGKFDGFTVAGAKKTKDMCHALISISESSSVQIIASAGALSADAVKACEMAKKSADFVAAKLP